MSKTVTTPYACQFEENYDLRRAYEETARCLLCEDAPCSTGCPAGTDPAKFIRSLRLKNVVGAAETIRENNPLGGSCASVCPYGNLCEKECSRTGIDKPIRIGMIQKFLVEQEQVQEMNFIHPLPSNGKRVACVGAGPASLSCARELALQGYDVTVYEAHDKAGGVLTYGILPSRLPQSVVDFDIETIKKAGVKFEFGKKLSPEEIKGLKDTYDAVFLGIGLWSPNGVDVPGKDAQNVLFAIDFLEVARDKTKELKLGENVVVIGGGDVAMDCAATAKQLGARTSIVYRRTLEEAPANIDELSSVQAMGIPIITEFAPEEILTENGKATALKAKGRDGFSELTLKADQIIFAIGQKLDDTFAEIKEEDGFYQGGDMMHGRGKTVVEAVADGKIAAFKIMEALRK